MKDSGGGGAPAGTPDISALMGAGGAAPAVGAGVQGVQTGGAVDSTGGRGQSSIPSIGTNFQPLDAGKLRRGMRKKRPKRTPRKRKMKKKVEKSKPKPKPEKKKVEVAKKVETSKPAPLPPPPPPSENRVAEDFSLARSLLKGIDLNYPFDGARSLKDIPLLQLEPELLLQEGVSAATPPTFNFIIFPMDHDPFNLGLPSKPPTPKESSFFDRLLDKLSGKPAVLPAAGEIGYYMAFDAPPLDADFLAGVPRAVFWSGPVDMKPLITKTGGGDPPKMQAVGFLGEDPNDRRLDMALWQWGLLRR